MTTTSKNNTASGWSQTRDVLHARQTLYQVSHRGSLAGQESLNVQRRLFPDEQG